MKDEKKLVYIPVDKIVPHVDNPRRDLGDLSELAESIKARGIMQNLTVVPCPARGAGMYVVIIGHRRLAASKLAGLAEVPCVVTEMSPEEQVATMLLENIARADLTPYEQAQGFQLMMEFGETVNTIAEKTGFSRSTVRRRLEMAKLDQKTLEEKSKNTQISLFEIDRLSEIEDLDIRNKVLKDVGTRNYEWSYKKAILDQQCRRGAERWRGALARYGVTEIEYKKIHTSELTFCEPSWVSIKNDPDEILAPLIREGITYVVAISGESVYLRMRREDAKKAEETDPEKVARRRADEERRQKVKALDDACRCAYECRMAFMKGKSDFLMDYRNAMDAFLDVYVDDDIHTFRNAGFNRDVFLELYGMEEYDCEKSEDRAALRGKIGTRNRMLTCFAYANLEDDNLTSHNRWYGTYEESDQLITLYNFLSSLGYEPSDEEVALLYGTSELYVQKEEKTDA